MEHIPPPPSAALAGLAALANAEALTIEAAIANLTILLSDKREFDDELRRRGIAGLIYAARTGERRVLRAQDPPAAQDMAPWRLSDDAADKITARVQARRTLYDLRLPVTDIALGDATADDLLEAANFHRSRANAELALRDRYFEVRKRLLRSKAKTVRAGVDLRTLADLMRGVAP